MNYVRGQIIYHNFILPGKDESVCHPVIIISNETVTSECNMYVGLMITSSDNYKDDYFTYELDESSIQNNRLPNENKFVRLHLIAYFSCNSARSEVKGVVKESVINLILDTQRERVFDSE